MKDILHVVNLPKVHEKTMSFHYCNISGNFPEYVFAYCTLSRGSCVTRLNSHVPYGHVDRTTFDTKYDSGGTF